MKKVNKVFVTALSCLLAATYVLPVSAQDEVEKKESVYTVLNADGSVKSITVSDTLHSDSGFNNYKDTSDLKDVENLKSNDEVNSTSGGYIWNTSDKEIYYQGTSTKELPLSVKITYTLDGKEITSDELVGQSGHLVIKVNVTNSSKQTYKANNKTYNLVTPFVTGLVAMLDDDVFSNVSVNSGTVTNDSSHSIIASVMVPGLKSGLKQVLDTDLMHKLEDYLIDEISIEADVTDYESPTLMMAAATSTDALKEEFDDIDEFSSIFDKLDDLKEATNELIDGTTSLYDGAVKLNDGVGTLKDGSDKLSSGAASLYKGADELASGAISLRDGLNKLSSKSDELRGGMSQVAEGILATVNSELKEAGYPEVTWAQVDTCIKDSNECIFNKYANITVTDEQRAAAKAEVTELVKAKVGESEQLEKIVNSLLYMASENVDSSKTIEQKITSASEDLLKAQGLLNSDAYKTATEYASALTNTSTAFDFTNADHPVNTVLTSIRGQQSLNYTENDLKTTYATILTKIKAAVKASTSQDIDDATAGFILAYACNNPINADVLGNENLGNAINKVLTSQTGDYTCDDPYNDEMVSQVVKAAYTSAVINTSLDAIYASVISTIVNTLVGEDATDEVKEAAKSNATTVFAYAVAKHNGTYDTSNYTPNSYFMEYANDLTTMKNIQTIMTKANSEEAKNVIDSVLTKAVKETLNSEMLTAEKTLTSVRSLVIGVNSYTAGVDEAYAGSKTLADGTSSLVSGSKQLREGIDTLNSGVATLKDGSQTLADGAKTLKEGMQKYNDEAISKLTESTRITSLQEASNLLEAMSNSEDNYNNFSGISEGTEGSIKFVFKIEGSKATKKEDTTTETTNEKVSFWQRIVNLFKH